MASDTRDAKFRPLKFGRWPRSILSHRRALGVLDAAAASVGALAKAIAVRGASRTEDDALHWIEVEGILHTLEVELQPFASPISLSVRNQWGKITEALPPTKGGNSEWTARAEALHRALEAQRRILAASAPAFSRSAVRKTSSLPPPHTPTEAEMAKPDQPQALKPDEAALLAVLIDKFYGSSAFKVIGAALVAAALLAGAGTVYLGTHTLTLREDLEKTEEKAKNDINASAKRIQDSITTQSNAGEKQIKQVVDDFTAKSDTLRADAIKAAIATLDRQLTDPVSTLSNAIKEKGDDATKHMDGLGKDVKALEERRAAIDDRVKSLEEGVQVAAPKLERLKSEGPKLDAIMRNLDDLKAKATASSNDAASQAQAAKQSASLAETARGASIKAVEEAESKLRNAGQVASDLTALNKQVSLLTDRVGEINVRLQRLEQPPKAPRPQTQTELSPQQWFEIQQSLAARGFNPGKIDGRPGNKTRHAIRLFQGATNQPVTGTLTAAQIEQLLTRQ